LLGVIAKTTGDPNTGSFTIVPDINTHFHIVKENSSAVVGEVVNKVGRTTGWTQGPVTATCVNTAVSGTNIVQICQNFVTAGVGSGDSSSPVFSITPTSTDPNAVVLRGILWGSSGSTFVYSPIGNIEQELGPLSTCFGGTCVE